MFELSKSQPGSDGVRPMHKTGTLGLVGPKVDSITYWTDKIRELTPQLEEERKQVQGDAKEDAAFVFFNDRLAAAEAAQVRNLFLDIDGIVRKFSSFLNLNLVWH